MLGSTVSQLVFGTDSLFAVPAVELNLLWEMPFMILAGLLYAIAVGVAFGSVTLLLYLTYARVDVSIGSPTIRVTGILLASLLGILLLREPFTWRYFLGLVMTVAGVALIVFR